MAGFVFRMAVCGALCLGLSYPVTLVVVFFMETRTWAWLGGALLFVWILGAMPLIWWRSYEWLERYGK